MGHRIGIVGQTNTGKSFSRRSIKNVDETFLISPSRKMTHLFDVNKEGKKVPVKPVNFTLVLEDKKVTYSEMLKNGSTTTAILRNMLTNPPKEIIWEGHFVVVKTLQELAMWSMIVDKLMPKVKTLLTPDFTHYISNITSSAGFRAQNSGGAAFSRFWDLGGDLLSAYFTNIDDYREDLVVVTEFHSIYDEVARTYKIFVPAGKMLEEKFLPDSYYDILLYTDVLDEDEAPTRAERYKFVTKRTGKFNARDADLFEEAVIPNDLQLVLDKYREANGI